MIDRRRLEASSCECYRIVRSEFDRLLERPGSTARTPSPLDGVKTADGDKTAIGDAVPADEDDAPEG